MAVSKAYIVVVVGLERKHTHTVAVGSSSGCRKDRERSGELVDDDDDVNKAWIEAVCSLSWLLLDGCCFNAADAYTTQSTLPPVVACGRDIAANESAQRCVVVVLLYVVLILAVCLLQQSCWRC